MNTDSSPRPISNPPVPVRAPADPITAAPATHPTTSPRRRRQLAVLGAGLMCWAVAYGTLRLTWVLGDRPKLPPTGDDLLAFSDWGIVILAAVAGPLGPILGAVSGRRMVRRLHLPVLVIGIGTGVLLLAAAAPFVLDLVALLFPGIGIPSSTPAFLARSAVVAGGVLLLTLTALAERDLRGACEGCGRQNQRPRRVPRPDPTWAPVPAPWWATAAAYLAVTGLVIRELAQAVVGFGPSGNPLAGNDISAGIAFVLAATLAGTVLPLAMVHRWGQRWPRWLPGLAGRRIPRWLPLGPAFGVSGALLAYFGVGAIQFLLQPSGGAGADSGHSDGFLSLAIGSYLLWGTGLGIAAVSYFFRTRPLCDRCGR